MPTFPCPQCGNALEVGTKGLCPHCGYFLKWSEPEAGQGSDRVPDVPPRLPPEDPDPPSVGPPNDATTKTREIRRVEAVPAPRGKPTGLLCLVCKTDNDPSRTICVRCGERLRGVDPAPPAKPPPPVPVTKPPSKLPAVVAGVLALVALGLAADRFWDPTWPWEDATQPVALITVMPDAVAASSVLPATTSDTYDPENLFDDDPATAWNHDFSKSELPAVGQRLEFTFEEAIDLRALEVVNGYAKSPESFADNARVASAVLHAEDGESFALSLEDTAELQRLPVELGPARSFVLEVTDVFGEDSRHGDLAISELRFIAAVPEEQIE